MSKIEIIFKCRCMPKEKAVEIPSRTDDMDIADWMEKLLQPSLTVAHFLASPKCTSQEMEYVKIPYQEGTNVGSKRSLSCMIQTDDAEMMKLCDKLIGNPNGYNEDSVAIARALKARLQSEAAPVVGVERVRIERLDEAMNHHAIYDGCAASIVRPDDLYAVLQYIRAAMPHPAPVTEDAGVTDTFTDLELTPSPDAPSAIACEAVNRLRKDCPSLKNIGDDEMGDMYGCLQGVVEDYIRSRAPVPPAEATPALVDREALENLLSASEYVREGRHGSLTAEIIASGIVRVAPIDMLLNCPRCKWKHVDKAEGDWTNPPHRSHLCEGCGCVWRPSDVATNGVEEIKTKGRNDW